MQYSSSITATASTPGDTFIVRPCPDAVCPFRFFFYMSTPGCAEHPCMQPAASTCENVAQRSGSWPKQALRCMRWTAMVTGAASRGPSGTALSYGTSSMW